MSETLTFSVGGSNPTALDHLIVDLLSACREADWGQINSLLQSPVEAFDPDKSGLTLLRNGITRLAKLAQEWTTAERRKAGWRPYLELLGDLVAAHGPPTKTLDKPHERRRLVVWDSTDTRDGKSLFVVLTVVPSGKDEEARVVMSNAPLANPDADELARLAEELRGLVELLDDRDILERALASVALCVKEEDLTKLRGVEERIKVALEDQRERNAIKEEADATE